MRPETQRMFDPDERTGREFGNNNHPLIAFGVVNGAETAH